MTKQPDPEWTYRYEERLGILTEGQPPTREQVLIAKKEADKWLSEQTNKQEKE